MVALGPWRLHGSFTKQTFWTVVDVPHDLVHRALAAMEDGSPAEESLSAGLAESRQRLSPARLRLLQHPLEARIAA